VSAGCELKGRTAEVASYRQERRKREYVLNNGSTMQVITEVDVDRGIGYRVGRRRIVASTIDGREVTVAEARREAKKSGHRIE
jgi:hypothetical protein